MLCKTVHTSLSSHLKLCGSNATVASICMEGYIILKRILSLRLEAQGPLEAL